MLVQMQPQMQPMMQPVYFQYMPQQPVTQVVNMQQLGFMPQAVQFIPQPTYVLSSPMQSTVEGAAPDADDTPADELPQLVGDDSASDDKTSVMKSNSSSGSAIPEDDIPGTLRVSRKTPLVALAGTLAKRLRHGSSVVLDAMGPEPVGQAMRALVLASSFLREDAIHFVATCEFERSEVGVGRESRPTLRITLLKDRLHDATPLPPARSVSVQDSEVGKIAGALARMVRMWRTPAGEKTGSQPLQLTCGPSATGINVAAKAIALARTMLHDNHLGFRIQPVVACDRPNPFDEALTFCVLPHRVQSGSDAGFSA